MAEKKKFLQFNIPIKSNKAWLIISNLMPEFISDFYWSCHRCTWDYLSLNPAAIFLFLGVYIVPSWNWVQNTNHPCCLTGELRWLSGLERSGSYCGRSPVSSNYRYWHCTLGATQPATRPHTLWIKAPDASSQEGPKYPTIAHRTIGGLLLGTSISFTSLKPPFYP